MSTGFCDTSDGKKSTPTCSANNFSCSIAAGRYTSADTSKIFFFLSCSLSKRDSLPTVVVLPAPCNPAINTVAGGVAAKFNALFSLPISSVKASFTMPKKAWSGVKSLANSCPKARSFTWFTKSFTIGNATSASNSARRTSRRASLMLSSVSVALPRMFLNTLENRLVRLSSMMIP